MIIEILNNSSMAMLEGMRFLMTHRLGLCRVSCDLNSSFDRTGSPNSSTIVAASCRKSKSESTSSHS